MSRRDLVTFAEWARKKSADPLEPRAERTLWRSLAEEIAVYLGDPRPSPRQLSLYDDDDGGGGRGGG